MRNLIARKALIRPEGLTSARPKLLLWCVNTCCHGTVCAERTSMNVQRLASSSSFLQRKR
jgi:hypothetical protein